METCIVPRKKIKGVPESVHDQALRRLEEHAEFAWNTRNFTNYQFYLDTIQYIKDCHDHINQLENPFIDKGTGCQL